MMAENPNSWWSINTMHPQQPQQQLSSSPYHSPPPPASQYLYGSNSSLPSTSLPHHHPNHEFPRSWSQLLLGGLPNEQERFVSSPFQYKKLENWDDQILNSSLRFPVVDVKQEVAQTSLMYGAVDDEFQGSSRHSWSQTPQVMPASSPSSCITSLGSSLLNFSGSQAEARNQHPENSSECNSSSAGGVPKKPKIQHSSTQPVLKVRKEKLGDRITALHQLVSPFGKTDTASVLSEAIGYIRFLQAQIEALSSPYLGNVSAGSMGHQEQSASESQDRPKDLKNRGLCLVPASCTQHVGSDNGADYWAPALGGGF